MEWLGSGRQCLFLLTVMPRAARGSGARRREGPRTPTEQAPWLGLP